MKIEKILDRLLSFKEIVNCDGDVYLKRYYLIRFTFFAVFIHKFVRSDEDRALHDHPWNFVVIPVWKGYLEHNLKNNEDNITRVYPVIGMRYRNSKYKHRVELIDKKPAWSIFIRFKRHKTWGFWVDNHKKFIDWRKWWKDNCE